MERFALKSFNVANLLHWAAGLTNPGQPPSPDQVLGLFRVLAGAEIKGVVAPYKNTKKLVTIDTLSLDWGQMIGSIPSKVHVVAKMVMPTDPSDPKQHSLMPAESTAPDRPRSRRRLDRSRPAAFALDAGHHRSCQSRQGASPSRARQRAARNVLARSGAGHGHRRDRSRPARSSSPCATAGSWISWWRSSHGSRMSAATQRAVPSST